MKTIYTAVLIFTSSIFIAQRSFLNYQEEISNDCVELNSNKHIINNNQLKTGDTIWSEDFGNGFPAGWTIEDLSGICPWVWSNDGSWGYFNSNNGASAGTAINSTTGFVAGMLFWGLALREIWSGEAAEANAGSKNKAGHYAYDNLKKIVTFGWIIYPAGYALGYFGGGVDMDVVNQVYNLADFVNKILPGVIVWAAARMDTK